MLILWKNKNKSRKTRLIVIFLTLNYNAIKIKKMFGLTAIYLLIPTCTMHFYKKSSIQSINIVSYCDFCPVFSSHSQVKIIYSKLFTQCHLYSIRICVTLTYKPFIDTCNRSLLEAISLCIKQVHVASR